MVSAIYFLDQSPQARATEAKINKGLNSKLNSFCKTKETYNIRKRQPSEWEKTYAKGTSSES